MTGYINRSKTDSWATPPDLLNKLKIKYNLSDFDPCPYNPDFDINNDINGLDIEWADRTFVNPPYSDLKTTKKSLGWVEKSHIECQKGKFIVMLIPARTDTTWFHDIILANNYKVEFIRGRLKFGTVGANAPFPSMLVFFEKKKKKKLIIRK